MSISMVALVELCEKHGWRLQDGPLIPWLRNQFEREAELEAEVLALKNPRFRMCPNCGMASELPSAEHHPDCPNHSANQE